MASKIVDLENSESEGKSYKVVSKVCEKIDFEKIYHNADSTHSVNVRGNRAKEYLSAHFPKTWKGLHLLYVKASKRCNFGPQIGTFKSYR